MLYQSPGHGIDLATEILEDVRMLKGYETNVLRIPHIRMHPHRNEATTT